MSEEEEEEDIESEDSESDDSNVDEENSSGTESDASGASEIRKKEEDAERKTSLLKRKRKQLKQSAEKKKVKLDHEVEASKSSSKKLKKKKKTSSEKTDDAVKTSTSVELDQSKPTTSGGEKPATVIAGETTTLPKKEAPDFSDKNVDYDLFKDDPTRVIQKKCKLSRDVVMSCKMITVNQPKLSFEYAAVVFARKGKADKAFEFNLPLELAPRIISGLTLMMKDYPRFFENNSIKS